MEESVNKHNKTSKVPSKTRRKIDLNFLLEKYGSKKKVPKIVKEPEPKFFEKGFSVKFKLSHAYKGLEKQEQEVSEPKLEMKPKLTARQIRRLAAESESKTQQNVTTLPETVDRLSADLEKYAKIGQLKREKTKMTIELANEQKRNELLGNDAIQSSNKRQRKIPLSFWKSLSKRTGSQKDTVLDHADKYEDKTFLTNADADVMLRSSIRNKGRHKGSKTVRISLTNKNSSLDTSRHSPRSQSTSHSHGSRAVQEWEKRKLQRKQRKLEQKHKLKNAQKKNTKSKHSTKHPSHQGRSKSSRKQRSQNQPSQNSNLQPEKPDVSKRYFIPYSNWTRTLHSMYLEVPDNFEEPSLKKILKKEKENQEKSESVDSKIDEEESEKEQALTYKPLQFLYGMCNCQQVAKANKLKKLRQSNKVAGVIEIYGCEAGGQDNLCPFCKVLPKKRIEAWIADVEEKMNI